MGLFFPEKSSRLFADTGKLAFAETGAPQERNPGALQSTGQGSGSYKPVNSRVATSPDSISATRMVWLLVSAMYIFPLAMLRPLGSEKRA